MSDSASNYEPPWQRADPAITSHRAAVRIGRNLVLDDVSFEVPAGTLVGMCGPNGAGKSTLLKAMVGLRELDSGSILVHGQPPRKSRGRISYIPQSDSVNWDFPVSVWDVVKMGCSNGRRFRRIAGRGERELVQQSLETVRLADRANDALVELSGGQRERVFVARALAQRADVLLLDEAFAGVDVASQVDMIHVLRDLCDAGKTVLMTTHDVSRLDETFDLVLCLNRHVCGFGPPSEALTPEVFRELYEAHGTAFVDMA